jgi:hypothetical protein
MIDPVALAARAVAARFAPEYDYDLVAATENALGKRQPGQRPRQYIDPVSVGSLIVAVATLAWTVYSDQRKKNPDASDDALESTIRVECRKVRRLSTSPGEASVETEITECIATEITRVGRELR